MYDAPDANSLSLLFPSSIPFQLAFFCIQVQRSAGQFADYHSFFSFFSFFSFNPVYNTLSFFLCYVFHIPTLKIFVASHSKDEYLCWVCLVPAIFRYSFFSFSLHLCFSSVKFCSESFCVWYEVISTSCLRPPTVY